MNWSNFVKNTPKQIRVPKIKRIQKQYNTTECVFNGKTFENPQEGD